MANSSEVVRRSGAVGSDPEAARHFADKSDFGVPAADAGKYPGLADEAKNQPGGDHLVDPRAPRSETAENRDAGVCGHSSGAGSSSGGDVDTDWVGVGSGGSGLASSGPESRQNGADMTDGFSDSNASIAPHDANIEAAHGSPVDTRGIRPNDMKLKGTTVNRDGGDATTTGFGQGTGSVQSIGNGDDAEAGEISLGEAGGIDN